MAFLMSEFMKCNLLKNYGVSLVKSCRGLVDKSVSETGKFASATPQDLIRNTLKPTNFQKKILVWTGRYKNAVEIPEFIPSETMQTAKSKMRMKVSNYLMVATLFGCVLMVILGKRDAEAGKTLAKQNLDWHKEYNEQAKAEAEAKKVVH